MFITLSDIFKYANCTPTSRNFLEGEQVLNSNQVILCGKIKLENDPNITIKCLVMQSSNISEMPHEVTCKLSKIEIYEVLYKLVIQNCICSCKAGESESCKHSVALLLFMNRNDIENINDLSSTDIKCQWNRLKQPSLEQYKPVPIGDYCCVKRLTPNSNVNIDSNQNNYIRNEFIKVADKSSLALHARGRTCTRYLNDENFNSTVENLFPIIDHELLTVVEEYPVLNLGDCCMETMLKLMKYSITFIRIKSLGDKSFWRSMRQFRITGSRCYQLYTYGKRQRTDDEWATKSSKYFWPLPLSNKFVKHGIQYELTARELYIQNTKYNVVLSGLISSDKVPWIGYSPDGVILNSDKFPIKLLEIKCPFKGSSMGLIDLLNNLNYIVKGIEGQWLLKEKHAYYCQIQLGMLMLNVNNCDFVIYNSLENNYFVINVEINLIFCKNLLLSLKIIYFEKMIHHACDYNNK